MRSLLLALLFLLPLVGCASQRVTSVSRDRNLLTYEEVNSSDFRSAYDAVRALRPQWLQTRGTSSLYVENPVMVYVDGSQMGGPDSLSAVSRLEIEYIRYYSPADAQSRWGLNHTNGAIEVVTRRG